jgi:hypothetical protein
MAKLIFWYIWLKAIPYCKISFDQMLLLKVLIFLRILVQFGVGIIRVCDFKFNLLSDSEKLAVLFVKFCYCNILFNVPRLFE